MKKLITLLLFVTVTLTAQERGDNTLFIETDMQAVENLLLRNFYEIETLTDARFSTKPKPIEGSVYAYDLRVSLHGVMIDGKMMIYANYSFRGGTLTAETYSGRAEFHRRRLVGKRLAFDEMDYVFSQLGKTIIYQSR